MEDDLVTSSQPPAIITMIVLTILLSLYSPAGAELGLWFVRSPEPIVAPVGDDVVFECSLNVPAESVRWRHNGIYLPHDHPPPPRPTSTSRYVVKFNDEKQEGDYQCVAWFGASALASTPARLTLAKLQPFQYEPNRHYVVTGGNNVVINCPPPISKPPAIIQYLHNKNIMSESSTTILPTTGSLLLSNVSQRDSGIYTCSATNYITGQIIDSPLKVTLSVEPPGEPASPRFLYTPQAKYIVQTGQNVSVECSGVGTPPPNVTWRRLNGALPKERADLTVGALRLTDIKPSDQGQYVCELSNGVPPMVAHLVTIEVQVAPVVTKGPSDAVVEENNDTELNCEASGAPTPNITWLLNGESVDNDSHISPQGGKLLIKKIQKRHAGIYQCFATNAVGTTYGSGMIQVSPIQVTAQAGIDYPPETDDPESMEGSMDGGASPNRNHKKDHTRKAKGRRKDKKHKVMVPPTRPNVTRLSDKSVMVRWSVPPNSGLPIQFFKVQYQDLDATDKTSDWMTSNEDIQPHIRSYEVDGLTTDHHYRFRIAAVYSNNDNKLGRTSPKFHLQRGLPSNKNPLYPPALTHTEAAGPTAIRIHWEYLNSVLVPVDGFYVYYRATTSAGDYIKATVEGQNARTYVITHLQPDTAYDIKVQSFTVGAASEFSAVVIQKTHREPNATSAPIPEVIGVTNLGTTDKSSHGQLYLVLVAVITGLTLLLTLAGAICICYRRSMAHGDHDSNESCDKSGCGVEPGLTIQQLEPVTMNGFTHNGKVNGRLSNGYLPRPMNITNNPLADSEQEKNVMELTYMTSQNNNCSSEGRSDMDDELDIEHSKRRNSWRTTRMPRTGENYV